MHRTARRFVLPLLLAACAGGAAWILAVVGAPEAKRDSVLERAAPAVPRRSEPAVAPRAEGAHFGFVFVVAQDFRGRPLVGHEILLSAREGIEDGAPIRIRTDARGQALRARVPAGRWRVAHAGSAWAPEPRAIRFLPPIEVRADEQTVVELALKGDRRLSGAVSSTAHPSARFVVELRRDSTVVAHVAPAAGRGAAGAFAITGLEPGRYALRLHPEGREHAFTEEAIDLTSGDLALPPRDVAEEDFAARSR